MSEPQRGRPMGWEYLALWSNGQIDFSATMAALPANDHDAAKLLADERPGELHHAALLGRNGTWFIWDRSHHRPDDSSTAERMILYYADRARIVLDQCRVLQASAIANSMAGQAQAQIDAAVRQAWKLFEPVWRYHAGLKKTAGWRSLLSTLASVVGCSEGDMRDRWPEHLNCRNGVVSLRTGELLPHDPRWMMTYCLDVDYVPGARGAEWERLTWHVSGRNSAVCTYMIQMLGYSCLGSNPDALVFFLSGPTASGKTVLMDVVGDILGPLYHNSSSDLICSSGKGERHARVENSIAGKRYVTVTETSERMRIDEGQLKRLTGDSRISHHRLYKDVEVMSDVTWAIWIATNELPSIGSFDEALRRRLRVIPAGVTIPEHLRDKRIRQKITSGEREAVLAALVWGCMACLAAGDESVLPPPDVELATAEYEHEQNTVLMFFEACCQQLPSFSPNGGAPLATSQAQSRIEYLAWCRDMRLAAENSHAFHRKFRELPGIQWDVTNKRYLGLVINRGQADRQADR